MEIIRTYGTTEKTRIYLNDHFDDSMSNEFRKLKGRYFKIKKYWVFPKSIITIVEDKGSNTQTMEESSGEVQTQTMEESSGEEQTQTMEKSRGDAQTQTMEKFNREVQTQTMEESSGDVQTQTMEESSGDAQTQTMEKFTYQGLSSKVEYMYTPPPEYYKIVERYTKLLEKMI